MGKLKEKKEEKVSIEILSHRGSGLIPLGATLDHIHKILGSPTDYYEEQSDEGVERVDHYEFFGVELCFSNGILTAITFFDEECSLEGAKLIGMTLEQFQTAMKKLNIDDLHQEDTDDEHISEYYSDKEAICFNLYDSIVDSITVFS